MDNSLWTKVSQNGVAKIPAPLPKHTWRQLYMSLSRFGEWFSEHKEYGDVFDQTAKAWQIDSGLKLYFSGYFSPYYRDRTNQVGRDNKRVIQFCEPYYRYLCDQAPTLLKIPEFRSLVQGMMAALYSSYATFLPTLRELSAIDPQLCKALMPDGTLPPVVLRLIEYQSDAYYFTNPHVDKSAVTIILDTDEPTDQSCLVFAPRENALPRLSDFSPVQKQDRDALVFFGAAPQVANHGWAIPAPHAVRPLKAPFTRHVAIFFWLLPGVDLSRFDTATTYVNDVGLARPSLSDAA